jgi:hypothetical protein
MRFTVSFLLALTLLSAAATTAQESTPPPATGQSLTNVSAELITGALANAEAPESLPGNTDPEIVYQTWEEQYGEPLEGTIGAWVMTGSAQLPIASVLVFASPEQAELGLAEFQRESAATTAGELDAWVIADRGKWVCMTADGPVLIIGQAEPVFGEAEAVVQDRSCEAAATTHAWMLDAVGISPEATPSARISRAS